MIDVSDYAALSCPVLNRFLPRDPAGYLGLDSLACALGELPHRPSRMGSVHPSADISPLAVVEDNVVIGANCKVHEFSTVRSGSVLGEDVVVGFGCEVTRSLIGSGTGLSHRATVCSSLVGPETHLGAGVVLANTHLFDASMRSPSRHVIVRDGAGRAHDTGVAQLGVVVGDGSRIGMGSLLGPGLVVGHHCTIYPGVILSGSTVGPNQIVAPETRGAIATPQNGRNGPTVVSSPSHRNAPPDDVEAPCLPAWE